MTDSSDDDDLPYVKEKLATKISQAQGTGKTNSSASGGLVAERSSQHGTETSTGLHPFPISAKSLESVGPKSRSPSNSLDSIRSVGPNDNSPPRIPSSPLGKSMAPNLDAMMKGNMKELERALKEQRTTLHSASRPKKCNMLQREMITASRTMAKTIRTQDGEARKWNDDRAKLFGKFKNFRVQLVDSIKHAIDNEGGNNKDLS